LSSQRLRRSDIQKLELAGREVDFALRAYLYRSENVKSALLDFPIFHWEDDFDMRIKSKKTSNGPHGSSTLAITSPTWEVPKTTATTVNPATLTAAKKWSPK